MGRVPVVGSEYRKYYPVTRTYFFAPLIITSYFFLWKCDDKCDVAFETRQAMCTTGKGKVYPEKYCKKSKLPELVRNCSAPACEYQWYAAQWSEVCWSESI